MRKRSYKIVQGFLEEKVIGEVLLDHEPARFDLFLRPVKTHKGEIIFQVVGFPEHPFLDPASVVNPPMFDLSSSVKKV